MGNCVSQKYSNLAITQIYTPGLLDLKIHWDASDAILSLVNGEHIFETFECVEDARGSNGLGKLHVTNLRLIWIHDEQKHLSISVGLGTISYVHFNMMKSNVYGRVRAPHIMTQYNDNRYDFTFVGANDLNMKMFQLIDLVARRFRATRAFRNVVIRELEAGQNDSPRLINYGETFLDKIEGCKLTNSGFRRDCKLQITNRRLILVSKVLSKFHTVSIPFINIKYLRMRKAFYGLVINIILRGHDGTYTIHFPNSDIQVVADIFKDLLTLHQEAAVAPFFGPIDGKLQYEDNQFLIVAPANLEENLQECNICKNHTVSTTHKFELGEIEIESQQSDLEKPQHLEEMSKAPCSLIDLPTDMLNESYQEIDLNDQPSSEKSRYLILSDEHRLRDQDTTQCSSQADDNVESKISNIDHKMIVAAAVILQTSSGFLKSESQYDLSSNESMKINSVSHSSKLIRRCTICINNDSEVAFDPCGHICSCKECANKLLQCPLCRSQVEKSLRIFF